ncbi:DUF2818 family protein [Comamonas suwonensis]|uniref:DUF2818 family protein n=1 Tax=Comamonas suwonensis TaxID=2606214 RepID=A0A843B8W0_9BURK|nr:DUF2818 family protein [Comamonas suwonensis]MBI1625500.1 DUF2818 family protein [Comamonas suwonensis]
MSITASIWLIILAALVAANLPFINQRLGIVGPVVTGRKSLWVRLLEMVILYLLVGGFGLLLERRAGQISPQGWEFYAVTATLFLTLAFPGFVYRYLVHRKG